MVEASGADRQICVPGAVFVRLRTMRDEIEPRMTTLRKLAQALKVDPGELVE